MNLARLIFAALFLSIFFVLATTQITSCTKTEVIHDTTTVIKKDTVTVIDSFTTTDSIIDLHDGLIAHYTFTNGNLNDSSGYGNNIIFNNATPTTDRQGNANGAFLFNGTSSYMRVANSTSLNPRNITMMAIVKLNGFYLGSCHGNEIFSKGTPDYVDGQYGLRISDFVDPSLCGNPANLSNERIGGWVGTAGSAATAPILSTGQWYNFIFTYDGIVSKIYVNGQLQTSWSNGSISYAPNNQDLFIGRHEDNTNQYPYWFNGVIDEIRMYNRALPLNAIELLSQ